MTEGNSPNARTADSSSPTVAVEDVSPAEYARRTVAVDFLFLDDETCARCRGTDDALDAAIDRVSGLLDELGVDLVVRRIHVDDAAAARLTGLAVSPTIRVNGRDVQPAYATSRCESCGELYGRTADVDCRTWIYRGIEREVAPSGLLVEAILRAAVAPAEPSDGGPIEGDSPGAEAARSAETTSDRLSGPVRTFFGEGAADGEDERRGCC